MSFMQQFASMQALPPERFTVGDLCDAYLKVKEADPDIAYPKAIANSLKHIRAHFGGLPPSMVTRASVRIYIANRRKLVMGSTIDKELRFLRQALKFGVKEGWLSSEPHVETPGAGAPRQRFMSREEFARIYFHASQLHLRLYLALSIDTLARGKHVLQLTWDQVDFDRRIIWYKSVRANSRKKTQAAPISDRLLVVLTTARKARGRSGRVVEWMGKPVLSVRKTYEGACRRAGVDDAHKHDLRRSGASWAIQDGQSFDAVAALLGDSVEITRKHYAMFSATYLRGVVDSIAGGQGGRRA